MDFVARLREERRFPSIEALAAQIQAEFTDLAKNLGLYSTLCIGGMAAREAGGHHLRQAESHAPDVEGAAVEGEGREDGEDDDVAERRGGQDQQ